ncbi:MAG: bifunctional diaminohydroxyphosphoribosylaminopyrimidine deaminase/5-amino-6-(5-phosphoribosylamino)uracil reductase RibD [Desulfovibrio sp.]|nr:bifunctional diaminohydroxyphosphoribosylaminopyrimidine deaminase/5-amino-6-(5-phosphoribosylamino)uracil reductase RibD [Desulfovibrio sp.]
MTPDPSLYAPFMAEAIALAEKGRWHTAPNPTVGCVLIREGKIVATGYHERFGGPHAERQCLAKAKSLGIPTQGATLVVSLEPCNHFGKTPPCTEAIVAHGIKKVVYGLSDPNPQAQGGAKFLTEHGVEVVGPILEDACRHIVRDFLTWQLKKRPFFLLKLAATMDGHIATRNGASQWISNAQSRECVQTLRANVSLQKGALLVGGETFRADNPRLSVRNSTRQPLACVVTSHLPNTNAPMHLLQESIERTIFFVPEDVAHSDQARALEDLGVRVMGITGSPKNMDLNHLATTLFNLGCFYVLCEGGATLATSLLKAGLVDLLHLHLAPLFFADSLAKPLLTGCEPLDVDQGFSFETIETSLCAGDVHITLRPKQR